MKGKRVSVVELLNLIPDEVLDKFGEQTKVDYQVKKLTGKVVFKLFIYALASRKELSWRLLESIFSHYKFKQFSSLPSDIRADHSSLATRLSTIKVDYFIKIHESLCDEVRKRFEVEKIGGYRIVRFDSTLVSIAGTLLKKVRGMSHGVNKSCKKPGDPVDIKFTIGFDGLSAVQADRFGDQKYLSEEIALKQVIENHAFNRNDLAVFDRGLNKRDTLDSFTDKELIFVTRMKTQRGKVKHQPVQNITKIDIQKPIETESLWIEKDQKVYLFSQKSKKSKHAYRLIQAKGKKTPTIYYFLTNEMDLTPQQVVLIYKRRWDIEVFFKFLKQEFGFKHLLSRNQNGIEAVLYMTLITFTLIYLYYKANKIQSFKIAKIQFVHELDFEVMKTIVQICRGDPDLLHLLNPF